MPLKRINSAAAIAVLAAALATPSIAAEPAGAPVADFTLANGLELVVIPDHRAPVVTHMIWYKVGAADETAGKSGLAHFLEHLNPSAWRNHPDSGRNWPSGGWRPGGPPCRSPAFWH